MLFGTYCYIIKPKFSVKLSKVFRDLKKIIKVNNFVDRNFCKIYFRDGISRNLISRIVWTSGMFSGKP